MTSIDTAPPTPIRVESLADVQVRLALPHERLRWDELMRMHHFLGFKQFAGRGLRYIADYHGQWVALLGWQTGAFKCGPRDRWLGWPKDLQFQRLHLIANSTRFLILPGVTGTRNLGSYALGTNLRRLSDDWRAEWGHALELAEAFMDPSRHDGAVYKAANFQELGTTKGYARSNGKYTDHPSQPKRLLVYPLRHDARERLSAPAEQPEWHRPGQPAPRDPDSLRSLRALCDELDDPRQGPALRHPLGAVLSLILLAKLSGWHGGRGIESFTKSLLQKDLEALGCRFDRRAKVYRAPSDTTFQRVQAIIDPQSLEQVLERWIGPRRKPAAALAGDGKRICEANRPSAEGEHWETVMLVDHRSCLPLAGRSCCEEGGELAAMLALFEEMPLAGTTLTLDAGHISPQTVRALREQHDAQVLCRVNGSCPETLAKISGVDWKGPEVCRYGEPWVQGRGQWDRCLLEVVAVEADWLPFPDVQQVFLVTHRSKPTRESKEVTVQRHYGFTSLPAERASAYRLLTLHRGHWTVENGNHLSRDVSLLENESEIRTGHGSANNAALNNLALALIKRSGEFATVPEDMAHYRANRAAAPERMLTRQ